MDTPTTVGGAVERLSEQLNTLEAHLDNIEVRFGEVAANLRDQIADLRAMAGEYE